MAKLTIVFGVLLTAAGLWGLWLTGHGHHLVRPANRTHGCPHCARGVFGQIRPALYQWLLVHPDHHCAKRRTHLWRNLRLPNQHLIVTRPVKVTRVEQIDPSIQRGSDCRDALPAIFRTRRAVAIRHAHASESYR